MMFRSFSVALLLMFLSAAFSTNSPGTEPAESPVTPLANAHAHNDYHHRRPLLDALSHGFCSVEADIFLVDDQLLVGHDRYELHPDRTLQKLYLDPLRERARAGQGRIHPGGPSLTLLIDIKTDASATMQKLHEVLADYEEMLTTVRDGRREEKAVSVVVSGNRDAELIAGLNPRFVGIDGRMSDLDRKLPPDLYPLLSDSWGSQFRWRGVGDMPVEEREKLRAIIRQTHDQGQRARFWAAPDVPAAWQLLAEENVDLINTDNLPGLEAFLRGRAKETAEK